MASLKTIDAHAAGGPLRLVVEGMPSPRGKTMRARADWMARHADSLRTAMLLEPRGHRDLVGAMLTEPVSATAHAGLIFMNASGYPPLSGHGSLAATTIALERGLLVPGGDGRTVTLDTVAGPITARTELDADGRIRTLRLSSVPSFVWEAGLALRLEGRTLRADVAFGGAFYAVVDAEAVGLGVETAHLPALRRLGQAVARAADAELALAHPLDPHMSAVHGTVFTAPPHGEHAHIRLVTVLADGEVGRAPSGTGLCAVLAVLDAMDVLGDNPLEAEGLLDGRFVGRIERRTLVGERPAIVPELTGQAWITGEHHLLVNETDPLGRGVLL